MSRKEKLLARLNELKWKVRAIAQIVKEGKVLDPEIIKHSINIHIIVRDAITKIVKCERWVHNLITTAGKNKLLAVASGAAITAFVYIAIGTNATAANAADTALGTEVARSPSQTATNPSASIYQVQYTFPAGTGTGTIVEAGLLNASSSGTLLNRSVFGAITKAAGDELTMTIQIT